MVVASGRDGSIAWGGRSGLCFYWGSGYTGFNNYHNSLNYALKTYGFYCVQIIPKF